MTLYDAEMVMPNMDKHDSALCTFALRYYECGITLGNGLRVLFHQKDKDGIMKALSEIYDCQFMSFADSN